MREELTLSFTTKPFFTGPMNEKWVIKSVVVVSYGNEDTNTVILHRSSAFHTPLMQLGIPLT